MLIEGGNSVAYESMGATLLSQQPLTPKNEMFSTSQNWMDLYAHLETSFNSKRSWRWSWWSYWSVLAEYFLPRRYIWVVTANRMSRGHPINGSIIDSTGAQAVRTCAAGLWSGLTSPSTPWFRLGVSLPWWKPDADSLAWLQEAQDGLYTVLAQSNFYDVMAQAFQDVVVFGTAPVIVYNDEETVVRFYLPCAGEYYLAVGARLEVDTLDREFTLTVKQIVEQFTLDYCPPEVQSLWRNGGAGLDNEFVVRHSIEPNYAVSKSGSQNASLSVLSGAFTYREVYWCRGFPGLKPMSLKGFLKKPFMVARWATTSNDAYGRSPCMDALGDNKQVQQETKRKAEFIEKGVRPPMGGNPELKSEPSSILPGNVTYASTENGKKGFWPLFEPQPQWLAGLTADIALVNQRIQDCLFVNVFMAISRMAGVQPRNELELTKRDLERLQELGPFISKFETEFADPTIVLTLETMIRRRMLRPMPPGLQGVPLKPAYRSIMRIAQQAAQAVGMKDFMQTIGAMSTATHAAGVPDPIRTVDWDKAAKRYGSVTDWPSDLFFSEQDVAKHDQVRAQEMQKAQAPQQAMAAVASAKSLAETPLPGGNTALGAMLGGQGGGQ